MMTIRRRLLLLLLPALALLMLAGGMVDYWIAAATTRSAYDRALGSATVAMAANLDASSGQLRYRPITGSVPPAAMLGTTLFAIIADGGQLIAGTAGLPMARAGIDNPSFGDADYLGQRLRLATLHLRTSLGSANVTVAESYDGRAATQRVMLMGKLMVDFAELDVMLILIWLGVYFGLRPLERLRAQVELQSPSELHPFRNADVPADVRPLTHAFNHLLSLLEEAAQSQRRFVANAAHQMRTPVAGLLAQLELLLKEPRADAVRAEVSTIERGIRQLAHIANQLLSLARAEPATDSGERLQSVSLRALAEQAVERNVDRADGAGIDLGAELSDAAVQGDPWLLEDMLGNLVDNALKYTPRGGRVTVRVGVESGHPFLEVDDSGPGIPESERSRVRERFYRRPGAAGYGTGLGLAIVEEIARRHQAHFIIGDAAGGQGARMRVRFAQRT